MRLYYAVSDYYKQTYGEKVYKLPVNLPVTCPNRDGTKGQGGCLYCAPAGAGYEALESTIPVEGQLTRNMEYIGGKYHARLFIAYFQNFCNTYIPPDDLYRVIKKADMDGIMEIHISTRPDCVSAKTASVLKKASEKTGKKITVELGLQSVNIHTLKTINRRHTLAEFIDAVLTLHEQDISVTAHIIADLPWDGHEDIIECSKILSSLRVEGVKIHSLYVPKYSDLEKLYIKGQVCLLGENDYISRVISFLCYLNPGIVIHRLIGRIPPENSVTANFNRSWWVIKEKIENTMLEKGLFQGIYFDYLNGSALSLKGF